MERKGKSRRRSFGQTVKQNMDGVLATLLTIAMILNMSLSGSGLSLKPFDAFASGNDEEGGTVWATASNAKLAERASKDVDIYVTAEDNDIAPGNTTSFTLYLKNNTSDPITDGVLSFKSKYIDPEDGVFTHVVMDEEVTTIVGGTAQTPQKETSGEELTETEADAADEEPTSAIDEGQAETEEPTEAEVTEPEAPAPKETILDKIIDTIFPDEGEAADDNTDSEEATLEDITLQPGALYKVQFDFYTADDFDSKKANVKFIFKGLGDNDVKIRTEEKFSYSIGLPTVNAELGNTDNKVETGVDNDLNLWLSEPDWVDEKLEERIEKQEQDKADAELAADEANDTGSTTTATGSNAPKATASDAPAPVIDNTQVSLKDETTIEKYTGEAMTIKESKVNYTVEIRGANVTKFQSNKLDGEENIGWINTVYRLANDVKPGMYYGKVTANGKWNNRAFTSEQGFLFEVVGEGDPSQDFEEKLDGVTVTAHAEEGVLPEGATMKVTHLKEEDDKTADQFQEAKKALDDDPDTEYDGMMALDITFYNDRGKEIEPNGAVDVSINLDKTVLPEDVDPESVEVLHLDESTGDTVIEKVADTADATNGKVEVKEDTAAVAEFSVESFSTFTITWTQGKDEEKETYMDITVHFWDVHSNKEIEGLTTSVSVSTKKTYKFSDYSNKVKETDNVYVYQGAKYSKDTTDSPSEAEDVHYMTTRKEAQEGNDKNVIYCADFYAENSESALPAIQVGTISGTAKKPATAHIYLMYEMLDGTYNRSWANLKGTKPNVLKFYVNLASKIEDSSEVTSNRVGVPQANFTGSVQGATGTSFVNPPTMFNAKKADANDVIVLEGDNSSSAYAIDETLRKIGTESGYENSDVSDYPFKSESFPSDADVFNAIKDDYEGDFTKQKEVTVDNAPINIEDLNTENYAVRWYVLKYHSSDGWHIDGVIVPKSGGLTVTKTIKAKTKAELNLIVTTLQTDGFKILVNDGDDTKFTCSLTSGNRLSGTDDNVAKYEWKVPFYQDNSTYTIIEEKANPAGWTWNAMYSITEGTKISSEVAYPSDGVQIECKRVAKDDPAYSENYIQQVGLVNTYDRENDNDLTVEKTISGVDLRDDNQYAGKTYKFLVEAASGTPALNVGDTYPVGKGSETATVNNLYQIPVSVTGAGSVTIHNLPTGTYKVTEDISEIPNLNDYYYVSNDGPKEIKLPANEAVEIQNTYEKWLHVTVKKIVTGNMGDRKKDFEFTARIYDETGTNNITATVLNGENGFTVNAAAPTDAYATFSLKSDASKVIPKLRKDYKIVINEVNVEAGYRTSVEKISGDSSSSLQTDSRSYMIDKLTQNTEIQFTNTKNVDTPTGISRTSIPYYLILALAVLAMTGFTYTKRRKETE